MKPVSVQVKNFGSYPELSFDFTEEGLSLIYGATGSGKSTFMDVLPWVLFGTTAKEGNVDDIRSWQAMEEPTEGTAVVQCSGVEVSVHRVRGTSGQNDLYWTVDHGEPQRGSNLADTQRRLETILACSAETYVASAYFHEFSPAGTFFQDKPKAQRSLLEAVAPLEFPAALALKASESRKETRKALDTVEVALAGLQGRLAQAKEAVTDAKDRSSRWDAIREAKAIELATKAARFEVDRSMEIAKLESVARDWMTQKEREFSRLAEELLALERTIKKPEDLEAELRRHMSGSRCDKCQSLPLSANSGIMQLQQQKTANNYNIKYYEQGKLTLQKLNDSINPHEADIAKAKQATNTYLEQVAAIQAEVNPFVSQAEKVTRDAKALSLEAARAQADKGRLERRVSALTQVYDYSFILRGRLLVRTVKGIEEETNRYLEKYFDGEIKVGLTLDGEDLKVELQKSGHECVYRQLSKGQRGLLRLAFGIATMEAVGNKSGAAPGVLMLDEALDGLDESLKAKAAQLFLELAGRHPSVFVIDHSPALQSIIDRQYRVTMHGDVSQITLES